MLNEGTLKVLDGTELFYRVMKPDGNPKAVTIVLHGHGDHSGGLQSLHEALITHEYIVYAMDSRGHGKSSGKRGFVREWRDYTEDMGAFRELAVSENPNLPLYIIGHSMGGVISLDYCLQHSEGLAGIVAIAPAISYEATRSEKFLIHLLGKLKPDYALTKPGDASILTRDPEALERIHADTLRHSTVTPGLGRGLMQAVPRLNAQAHRMTIPFLMQYGLEDQITPPGKLREFFDLVGSEDKQKFEYESVRHRPFEDLGKERFFEDLINWLDRQTANVINLFTGNIV
jgi:alpha-beta hydrolase superfamily lysophospholipase